MRAWQLHSNIYCVIHQDRLNKAAMTLPPLNQWHYAGRNAELACSLLYSFINRYFAGLQIA